MFTLETLKIFGLGFVMMSLSSTSLASSKNWSESDCLALNIYFEARSEPIEGQLSVALVTLNRVKSKDYPNSICEVVKQYKQFSWYWDGKSDRPTEQLAWHQSQSMAKYLISHFNEFDGAIEFMDVTNGSIWYYNPEIVIPYWHDDSMITTRRIGNHLFLKRRRM